MLNETNVPLSRQEIMLIVETIFDHARVVDKLNDCGALTPSERNSAARIMTKQLEIVIKLKKAAETIDRQNEMMSSRIV